MNQSRHYSHDSIEDCAMVTAATTNDSLIENSNALRNSDRVKNGLSQSVTDSKDPSESFN